MSEHVNPKSLDTPSHKLQSVPTGQMERYREAEIEICYRAPYSHEWRRWNIRVSDLQAECLSQLPRGRELYWDLDAQRIAAEMKAERRRLANSIAAILTEKFLEMAGSGDPIMGYEPEVWKEMHAPSVEQEGNEVL